MMRKQSAFTANEKIRLVKDFLRDMGVNLSELDANDSWYQSLFENLLSSGVYRLLGTGNQGISQDAKEEVEQMVGLFLSGINPTSYWKGMGTPDNMPPMVSLLNAFKDQAASYFNWDGQSTKQSIQKGWSTMRKKLGQKVMDEERTRVRRQNQEISRDQAGESETGEGERLEAEEARSVSIGQSFNLNSWDEISSGARKDENVARVVEKIEALFNSNASQIGSVVVEVGFKEAVRGSFYEKLFLLAMNLGDFIENITVNTIFGGLDLKPESVYVPLPKQFRSTQWKSALFYQVLTTLHPEYRFLRIMEDFSSSSLGEGFQFDRSMKYKTPLSTYPASLPKQLDFKISEIPTKHIFEKAVSDLNKAVRESSAGRHTIYCVAKKDWDAKVKAAVEVVNKRLIKGVLGKAKPAWKRGMDVIVKRININSDSVTTDWIQADPIPRGLSSANVRFIDYFQTELLKHLSDLSEAHAMYELRNIKYGSLPLHPLSSKIAHRYLSRQAFKKNQAFFVIEPDTNKGMVDIKWNNTLYQAPINKASGLLGKSVSELRRGLVKDNVSYKLLYDISASEKTHINKLSFDHYLTKKANYKNASVMTMLENLKNLQGREKKETMTELSDYGINTIRQKFSEMGIRDRQTQQKVMEFALDNAKALRLTADKDSLKKFGRVRFGAGIPVLHPETGERIRLSKKMRFGIFFQLVGKGFIK